MFAGQAAGNFRWFQMFRCRSLAKPTPSQPGEGKNDSDALLTRQGGIARPKPILLAGSQRFQWSEAFAELVLTTLKRVPTGEPQGGTDAEPLPSSF